MDNFETNLPKTALALYIKIFCKKRGAVAKDKKVLIEAIRSWLSLSKSDKQEFINKYNDYQKKIKMTFADYLKNAEPYLKMKKNKKEIEPKSNIIEQNTTVNSISTEEIDGNNVPAQNDGSKMSFENLDNNGSVPLSTYDNTIEHDTSIQLQDNLNNSCKQGHDYAVVEPTPPKYLTGKELFSMINEKEDSNLSWNTLSATEKGKYHSAVLAIKRNYLKEYRFYLEQLPSEKLFYYYKNNIY